MKHINYHRIQMMLLTVLGLGLLATCIQINGSGYDSLSPENKAHVKVCDRPMSEISYDGNVYQVTVDQVKELTEHVPELLVYEYLPFCNAPSCVPPSQVLKFCKRKGLSLCVISDVYDGLFDLQQKIIPIFVINHTVYGTDDYQEYSRHFYDELTGIPLAEREYHTYHYFKNGQYVCSYGSLESVHRQ